MTSRLSMMSSWLVISRSAPMMLNSYCQGSMCVYCVRAGESNPRLIMRSAYRNPLLMSSLSSHLPAGVDLRCPRLGHILHAVVDPAAAGLVVALDRAVTLGLPHPLVQGLVRDLRH